VRVVSVLPSATEIVCALGARGELVGRSAECDYPADVRELPVVMRARTLDGERPSAEIDARVRTARARGESLYAVDVERLRAARPDVLFTQDLCAVCSVTTEEIAQACAAAGVHPTVVSLSPTTLDEVWSSVETVGDAIGRPDEARRLATELRRSSSAVRAPVRGPRVAVVEWLDPPILAGLWAPAMVRAAGGSSLGPRAGEPGARTTWRDLAALRPDLLVLSPCSFSVSRSLTELQNSALLRDVVQAAPKERIFVADEAYFSRPGPRLADGVALLRALLARQPGPFPMPVARLDRAAGTVAA